jgi:hypothetical protein
MADIQIERKEGFAWWWVVLALIVLGLLAWMFLGRTDRDRVATAPVATEQRPTGFEEPVGAGMAAEPVVREYVATCAPEQPQQMALDHAHTARCIRMLADAVESAGRDPAVTAAQPDAELRAAREQADRLEQSVVEAEHATMTRNAFTSLATAVERMQDRHPGLAGEAADLRQAAERVSPAQPLLEQRGEVQNFFQRAGQIVSRMSQQQGVGRI